ncbi:two-partner secretion domain-containing protein [Burkholderia catarinensis]|uniref:two-partner secretion domain-containing protein n=1 Tax=Burkholderia catarinensis TaxID=1108140 RepID=UPI0009241317|nr:filamentous hemagglutinin N-terminal domain-containing protein [Burkholderia catarinensis]
MLKPLAMLVPLIAAGHAYAVQGGAIAAGTGNITQNGAKTQIDQTSSKLIVNWKNFDIARRETVNIAQPNANAAILNRVQSGDMTSIQGALNANGRVFVVNPNGIVVGQGATINANSVVLSAADVSDSDFMSNRLLTLQNADGKTGTVRNDGKITTETGALLAGARVVNGASGVVTARNGNVALTAGGKVMLQLAPDGSMEQVYVDTGAAGASAANDGRLSTSNGAVRLEGQTIDALRTEVVRNTGIVEARSLKGLGGASGSNSEWRAGTVTLRASGDTPASADVNVGGKIGARNIAIDSSGGLTLDGAALSTAADATQLSPGTTVRGNQVTVSAHGATSEGSLQVTGAGEKAAYLQQGDLGVTGGSMSARGFDSIVQNGGTLSATGNVDLSAQDVALGNVTTGAALTANAYRNLDVKGSLNAAASTLAAGGDLTVARTGAIAGRDARLTAGNDLNVDGRVDVTGSASWLIGSNVNIAGTVATPDVAGSGFLHIVAWEPVADGSRGVLRIDGRVDGQSVLLYGDRGVEQSENGILRGVRNLDISSRGRVVLNGTVHAPSGYEGREGEDLAKGQFRHAAGDYAPGQAHGATIVPVKPEQPGRGGSIVAGAGAIAQDGKATNVTQSTDRLVVNWKDFDIARDESINFRQPNANAAVLNRVASGKVTSIDGALNANGRVYVLNPDGIVVGKDATINANSVTLAAANTSDDDFMQKRTMRFSMDPATRGVVRNEGTIATRTGVALIGREASNLASGRITSGNGNVALAAGGGATMSLNADGSLNQLDVTSATDHALVVNDGWITANNGHASLQAYASGAADAEIARNRGQIDAINRSIAGRSANGLSSGDVLISGRNADGDQGGIVNIRGRITGQNIRLASTGDLNLSGAVLGTRNAGPDYGVTLAGRRVTIASTGARINGDTTVQGVGNGAVYVQDGPLTTSGKLSMSNIGTSR